MMKLVELLALAGMVWSYILCLIIGIKLGQRMKNGEEVKLPTINPIEIAKEHRAKKEAEMEQNRIDIIMRNIENYDGTSRNQEDVPRG